VNVRHPVVTNREFVAYLCESALTDRASDLGGEWGRPRHWCIRWGSICHKRREGFEGFSPSIGFNGIFECILRQKCIRLV